MPTVSPTPTLVNVDMDDVVPSAPKSPAPVPLDLAGQTISSCDDLEKGEHSAIDSPYSGAGTLDDPLVVRWLENDPQNPYNWNTKLRYLLVMVLSISALEVACGSSLYAGAIEGVEKEFKASQTVVELGLSFYVLGFALGPLIFGPFSEILGRRTVFLWTASPHALFIIGSACAPNIETLLITRFFSGFFGSSPLNNSAAAISDLFGASERALALSCFASATFLGPVIGPIAGSFMGAALSWRWIFWAQLMFAGIIYILGGLVPETYGPVLLRRRALKLTNSTTRIHVSEYDLDVDTKESLSHRLFTSSCRPFLMLAREAIVLFIAIFVAIVYGILYLMFGAFPIVFQETRGWSEGVASLPFIGVGVGMLIAVTINLQVNRKYSRDLIANGGYLPPEARLPIACFGGLCLPIGLFWFAWTVDPSIHFIVPCIATIPFGMGMVLVFLSLTNYMVDAYLIWSASTLAANAVFRSMFGAAFPLFTNAMFHKLGNAYALTILASLTLALVPIPFVFLKYGARIRQHSTYAPGHKIATDPKTREEIAEADLRQMEDLTVTTSRILTRHVV